LTAARAREVNPAPIPRLTRRKFLLGAAGLGGAAAAGGLYMRLAEPRWLRVARHHVRIPASSAPAAPPLRLVHLSDLHASAVVPLPFIAEAVALAAAQQPDLIAITGDFVTDHHGVPAGYEQVLARLSAAAPTFACLGNHDGGVWGPHQRTNPTIEPMLALLRRADIRCLVNEGCDLIVRGRTLQLIGLGDLWSAMCSPAQAFGRTPPRDGATRLVLNHNPDAKDLLRGHDWDLMLCGHTHGGQLRLPFFGTPFAPVNDKRYVEGLHRWENRWLHITRGVGNLHGVRFNCRPEISVIDLG
jgi:predicted MPP superfamily phosphohydrolase